MSSGGGGGGTTQVIEKADPWKPVRPFLIRGFNEAESILDSGPGPYQGDFVAGANPTQIGSTQLALDQIPGLTNLGEGSINLGQKTLAGDFLGPESNPFLQGAIDTAIRPIEEQYTRNVIPGIASQAIAQGAYGGSREGISQAIAANDFLRNVGDVSSQIAFANYDAERNRQQLAPQLISQGAQMQLLPTDIMSTVGDRLQGFDQQNLDNAFAQYEQNLLYPWQELERFMSMISAGTQSGFGTTSATQSSSGPSTAQNVLGGAIGGGGLGGSLAAAGIFGANPGLWPLAIGAGVGGLLGLF